MLTFFQRRKPPNHNSDDQFEELLRRTGQSNQPSLNSDDELSDNYKEFEQKNRSESITRILSQYENAYKDKVHFQKKYRHILFWACVLIICVFVAILSIILLKTDFSIELSVSNVATIITAVISFISSIVALVSIITKYCFPEKDEEYIIQVVSSIQDNDLEHYKEDNRREEAKQKKK